MCHKDETLNLLSFDASCLWGILSCSESLILVIQRGKIRELNLHIAWKAIGKNASALTHQNKFCPRNGMHKSVKLYVTFIQTLGMTFRKLTKTSVRFLHDTRNLSESLVPKLGCQPLPKNPLHRADYKISNQVLILQETWRSVKGAYDRKELFEVGNEA